MLVLGLNGNFSTEDTDIVPGVLPDMFHDASASLVRDGVVLAAVEEERLNRIKKTTKFPLNAIRVCLDIAGVTPDEIDAVGFYFEEEFVDVALNYLYLGNPAAPNRYSRELIKARLAEGLGWELSDDKLVYVPHHRAHAMSTYLHSGMRDTLLVVSDGRGETAGTTVYKAVGGEIEELVTFPHFYSLGELYMNGTKRLGYGLGDEYKVMGLAPYGDPAVYRDFFEQLITLHDEDGFIGIQFEMTTFPPLAYPDRPDVATIRRKGEPFTQAHMDFAAALQEAVERCMNHTLTHWAKETGLRSLAFGGGVAHNCSMNGKLLRSGLFDEIFVHPASHDAGAGLGAAYEVLHRAGAIDLTSTKLVSAALGPDLGALDDIERKLKSWAGLVTVERPEDVVDWTAGARAAGEVVGWAHGRSEFGPRALGNRSILADPRPKENQTRINAMVKKRESYRPFAPVATEQAAREYFELPPGAGHYEFMSFAVPVKPEYRAVLGATTHIDGTARLQVVTPAANERFHRLVTRFGALTGTPVLLNTSFNNNAEPIVQSLEDVLASFLTTGLDRLVVEDFVVSKVPGVPAIEHLALGFRPTTRIRATRGADGLRHEIYLDYSHGPRATISAAAFELLSQADPEVPLSALPVTLTDDVRAELLDLWSGRFFTLLPADAR